MSWLHDFRFGPMSRIVFGVGKAKEAGSIARELEGAAALVMTDAGLHRLGLTQTIEESLREAGVRVEVFNGVVTEPTLASVEAAVAMYRERDCDLIVAVGGGSSMDSAKAVSLLIGNGGTFTEYTQRRTGANWAPAKVASKKGPDIIAVPTTAGTGAEATSGMRGLRSGERHQAVGRRPARPTHRGALRPGPDDLDAPEGDGRHRVRRALAGDRGVSDPPGQPVRRRPAADGDRGDRPEPAEGVRQRAEHGGPRRHARCAATMVGTSFPFAGLIHVHTFAEVLGDLTHLPHGRLIGLMLPHVLEWVAPGCPEKLTRIAQALGERVDGLSATEGAERCLAAVRRLRSECEVEEPLSSHGMSEEDVQTAPSGSSPSTRRARSAAPGRSGAWTRWCRC